MLQRDPPLFPHLSLQPRSCSLHHPPLLHHLWLHPARVPGCTGTLWFRPSRCTAAHCSLSTAEPQLPQQEERTQHLPPLSSFLCLHLSFSPISPLLIVLPPLSISRCPVFLLPDHHLLLSLSRSIFLHLNTNFTSLSSLHLSPSCPKLFVSSRGQTSPVFYLTSSYQVM